MNVAMIRPSRPCCRTMAYTMTMNAPVGPAICTRLPPKALMKKPATMAVTRPLSGGTPLAMAKAMASGRATMPTMMPETMSRRSCAFGIPAFQSENNLGVKWVSTRHKGTTVPHLGHQHPSGLARLVHAVVLHAAQGGGVHPQLVQTCHVRVAHLHRHLRGTAQQPHVRQVVAHHQRVLVPGVQTDDVVAAVERPEEGHFEPPLVGFAHQVGLGGGAVPLALVGAVALVPHVDAAILAHGVGGGHV